MRTVCTVVGLVLLAGACGDDDDAGGTEPGTDAVTTAAPDEAAPATDEVPVTTDDPTPADDDGDGDPTSTLELNPPKTSVPVPPTTAGDPIGSSEALFAGDFDPGLDPFVDRAVADLAVRLDVDPDEVTPVSAVLVIWPNSSIGCPLPGMEYLQVLQDGSLIELEHDGTVYRYHTGGSRTTPFLCDQPLATPPVTTGGTGT